MPAIEKCKKCRHYYRIMATAGGGYNPAPCCHLYEDTGKRPNVLTQACFEAHKPLRKRKIPGTYSKVPGGYAQEIGKQTTLFVPDACAASFDPKTGELHGYAPDYAALEAAKAPAVEATKPGEYSYYYEDQKAPTGCDFKASLGYYGEHYYLCPLRDDLPQLHGRGITRARDGWYRVTKCAYEKIKAQYKISFEMCYD